MCRIAVSLRQAVMDVTVAVATSEPLSSTANRVSLKSSPFAGMSLGRTTAKAGVPCDCTAGVEAIDAPDLQ